MNVNIKALGSSIPFTTKEQGDRLIVAIKDKTPAAYIVDAPDVDDGLALVSIITQMLAPMISELAPPDGVDPKDFKPNMQDVLMGASIGLGQLSPVQFSALGRDIVKNVRLLVGENEVELTGEMYNSHFKRKLGHLGILIPQVIAHSDAALFFGGLVAMLKSTGLLEKQSAQKSPAATSEVTNT